MKICGSMVNAAIKRLNKQNGRTNLSLKLVTEKFTKSTPNTILTDDRYFLDIHLILFLFFLLLIFFFLLFFVGGRYLAVNGKRKIDTRLAMGHFPNKAIGRYW